MKVPLVTVIIPVFNQAEYLGDAIRSVNSSSSYEVQIIVINDGSDANNTVLIQKHLHEQSRALLLCHPNEKNLGVSASRLLGLKYAKGNYVAFLDADDAFEDGKLAAQVEFLEREESYGFAHTGVNVVGGPAEVALQVQCVFNSFNGDEDYERIHCHNKICFSSAMVRTSILRNLMFSLPYYHQYEDWALWNVLLEAHKGKFLPEPLTKYRVHGTAASESIRKSKGLALGALIEFHLSLTVVIRNPIHKVRSLGKLVQVLWQRRGEMISGLRKWEEYQVEDSYPNLLAVSLLEMKSKDVVIWGYGSLGRRLITSLLGNKVSIGIVVDKGFDGVTYEVGVQYLSPTAFFELADSEKHFLIVATTYYTEVISQIKKKRFSLDSVVVINPACDWSAILP